MWKRAKPDLCNRGKKWNNSDGTPLASPPDSIDFVLVMYSSKEKPVSGKSATVIGQIVNTANNKVRMTLREIRCIQKIRS